MDTMKLQDLESISVIISAWFVIFWTIYTFIRDKIPKKESQPQAESATIAETSTSEHTYFQYFRSISLYLISIAFFLLVLINISTNDAPIKALDVISISTCTSAIVLMIVSCAYKYILWKTIKAFNDAADLFET